MLTWDNCILSEVRLRNIVGFNCKLFITVRGIYMIENASKKQTKIFISHSSQDLAFVQPLVELFEYIGLNSENMFCSSISGYKVPLDDNIYEYLKRQFQNYDLRIIFVLSENYYNSVASLNEMGAAWVLQHKYTCVLLPQFDYRDVKGVVDHMKISIKLDSDKRELKDRLNELRNIISDEFGLNMSLSSQNVWERHRDEFIDKVNSTDVYWKQLRELREKNRPISEWVFPLKMLIKNNPYSYDAMYMLGTIYAETNDIENAIKYLKMTAKSSKSDELSKKANEKLLNLGYTV